MNKLTKQDVIDAKIVVHGAGEYSPTTYAVSVIEQLEEHVSALEQQLKTAKADGIREEANATKQEWGSHAPNPFKGCQYDALIEYANNLEGK